MCATASCANVFVTAGGLRARPGIVIRGRHAAQTTRRGGATRRGLADRGVAAAAAAAAPPPRPPSSLGRGRLEERAVQMAMECHGVQAVPRHPRVVGGHGLPELHVETHPCVRQVVSRVPVHVHLVRSQVGKQMRVVPDGRFEIYDPCLGPHKVIRYAGAAEPRGHRNIESNALRGQGMHDRCRRPR